MYKQIGTINSTNKNELNELVNVINKENIYLISYINDYTVTINKEVESLDEN